MLLIIYTCIAERPDGLISYFYLPIDRMRHKTAVIGSREEKSIKLRFGPVSERRQVMNE